MTISYKTFECDDAPEQIRDFIGSEKYNKLVKFFGGKKWEMTSFLYLVHLFDYTNISKTIDLMVEKVMPNFTLEEFYADIGVSHIASVVRKDSELHIRELEKKIQMKVNTKRITQDVL